MKLYLAYKKAQNFVCIEIYSKQILLYLKLKPDTVELEKGLPVICGALAIMERAICR